MSPMIPKDKKIYNLHYGFSAATWQNLILKSIFGVYGKASILSVRTELGTLPVCIEAYKLLYKNYLRMLSFVKHPDSFHSILI